MKNNRLRSAFAALLIFLCAAAVGAQCLSIAVPGDISVLAGADAADEIASPFVSLQWNEDDGGDDGGAGALSCSADAMLLGVIPLKSVSVSVYEDISLCPGGMPFGVKLTTEGILVVGVSEVDARDGNTNPGYEAGIRTGDVITAINGENALSADQLREAAAAGEKLVLTLTHGGEEKQAKITPVMSESEQAYKLGLWIKDRAAGIGTVSFYNPENGTFAGLGHGICDADTGILLPMHEGSVYNVRIDGVVRGEPGSPGELKGYFSSGKTGALTGNTSFGVYGDISSPPEGAGKAIPIGLKGEMTEGEAHILSTVDGGGTGEYEVRISRIDTSNSDSKNFVVEVTDPALLEATGGIVQGMSGSPVIQNGKLVGAVTHVLINDPTRGYGIFIENMLSSMPQIYNGDS